MSQENSIKEKVGKMLKELSSATQVRSMYSASHNLTKKAVNTLYYVLDDILFTENEITIGIIGNEIAFQKEPFYDISKQIQGFIQHLKDIKADKISFMKGVTGEDLSEFISILAMNKETLLNAGGIEKFFELSSIRNIAIGKIGYKKSEDIAEINEDGVNIAKKDFSTGEKVLKEITTSILESKDIDLRNVKSFITGIISNLLSNKSSLLILTAVKSHDEYSFVHNINVSIFSLLQAEGLGVDQRLLNEIGIAALLHDVGKLSIPGEILRKKGALTDSEFKTIKSHSTNGAKILLESPEISTLAALVAFGHHIRFDESGYPDRKIRDPLDLATMIVTISDFYDALRSKRSYAGEIAPEKTYEEMKGLANKFFHPDLLENFFNIVGVYPPGTLVELDTGEIALVIKESNLDIKRPQVEILYDPKGNILKNPEIVNLIEKDTKSGEYKRSIKQSIITSDKFKMPSKYSE